MTRADIEGLHRALAEGHGKIEANRTIETVRGMFAKAVEWGMMATNPALGFHRFKERPRERFLSPAELARVNEALVAEPDWRWRSLFPLLLLLGSRRGELLAAKWEHLDLDQRIWRIPTSKTGEWRLVPLPTPAVDIIEGLPSRGASEWLFPARGATVSGHVESPGAAWRRIRARAGVPDVRVHDLRRTLGSWLAGAGYNLTLIGKALGHSSINSTAIYARMHLDPVRVALEANAIAMFGGKA